MDPVRAGHRGQLQRIPQKVMLPWVVQDPFRVGYEGSDAEPVKIAEFSSENGEKNKRPKWRNEQIKVKGLLRVPCA